MGYRAGIGLLGARLKKMPEWISKILPSHHISVALSRAQAARASPASPTPTRAMLVSQAQLQQAMRELREAAGRTSHESLDENSVEDPITRERQRYVYGNRTLGISGQRGIHGAHPLVRGALSLVGLGLPLLTGERSPEWIAYQQRRANYEDLANRYRQWHTQQQRAVQDRGGGQRRHQELTGSISQLQGELSQERTQRRQNQQEYNQLSRDMWRNAYGGNQAGGFPGGGGAPPARGLYDHDFGSPAPATPAPAATPAMPQATASGPQAPRVTTAAAKKDSLSFVDRLVRQAVKK